MLHLCLCLALSAIVAGRPIHSQYAQVLATWVQESHQSASVPALQSTPSSGNYPTLSVYLDNTCTTPMETMQANPKMCINAPARSGSGVTPIRMSCDDSGNLVMSSYAGSDTSCSSNPVGMP